MFKRIIYLATILCCFSLPALAEIQPGAFTVSPMIGGHTFEGNLSLENSTFLGIGLGYNLTENWGIEGVYTRTDADADDNSTTDTRVETYHIDALYHFWSDKKLVPYFVAGIGGIHSSPDVGSSDNHLLFNYGVGVKYFIVENLVALRADVRHLLDFPHPDNSLQYSVGLTFQFGKSSPKSAPVPAPEVEPMAVVEPQPAPVAVPLDGDKDGVIDSQDKCPASPAGATVDSNGCCLDSDGDGVFDHLDQCPDTPNGVSVDAKGCPTKLTLNINFGTNSSKIGTQFDGEITKAVQCIKDYPGNVVFIDGYTDDRGAAAYNQKLSEQRATAVKNRLVTKFNIPVERLNARGFGEDQPIADNNTANGRATNRRVEVACGAK